MNRFTDRRLLADICEVNLAYLLLAQRLLREDLESAMFRLGIDRGVATSIEQLSPTQLVKLACGSSLLCSLRLGDAHVMSVLRPRAAQRAVQREHATILLASRPAQSWPEASNER